MLLCNLGCFRCVTNCFLARNEMNQMKFLMICRMQYHHSDWKSELLIRYWIIIIYTRIKEFRFQLVFCERLVFGLSRIKSLVSKINIIGNVIPNTNVQTTKWIHQIGNKAYFVSIAVFIKSVNQILVIIKYN